MIEETITDKIFEIFTSSFPSEIFPEYLEMFRKEMNKRYKKIITSLTCHYEIPFFTIFDETNEEELKFEDLLNQLPRFMLNSNLPCFPTLIFNVFVNFLIEYSHLIIPSVGFDEIVSKWKTVMEPDFQQIKFSIPQDIFSAFPLYWQNPQKKVNGSGQESEKILKSEFSNLIIDLFKENSEINFISKISSLSSIDFSWEKIQEISEKFCWRRGKKSVSGHLSDCASWNKIEIKKFEDFISKIASKILEENNKPSFLVSPAEYSSCGKQELIGFKTYFARRIQNAISRFLFVFNQNSSSSSIAKKQNLTLFVHHFFFDFYVPFYQKLIKKFYQVPNGKEYSPVYANCLDFNVGAKVTQLFIFFVSFKSIGLFSSFPELTFFPFARNAKKRKSEFIERKSDQIMTRLKTFFPSVISCGEIFEELQKTPIKGSGLNWNKILYNLLHQNYDLVNTEGFLHLPESVQDGIVETGKTIFQQELMEEDFVNPIKGLEKGKIVLDLSLIQEKRRQEMISLILRMGLGNALLQFFNEEETKKFEEIEQLTFLNSIPYADLEYLIQILRFEFLSYAAIDNGNENPILKVVFENIPIEASSSHLNMKDNLEMWCKEVKKIKLGLPLINKKDFKNLTKLLLENQIIDSHLIRSLELTEYSN